MTSEEAHRRFREREERRFIRREERLRRFEEACTLDRFGGRALRGVIYGALFGAVIWAAVLVGLLALSGCARSPCLFGFARPECVDH